MRYPALALALMIVVSAWIGHTVGIAPEGEDGLILPEGVPWGGIAPGRSFASPAEAKVISKIAGEISEERLRSDLTMLQGYGSRVYRAPGMYNCSKDLQGMGVELGFESFYQNFTVDRGSLGIFTLSNVIWRMPGTNSTSDRLYYLYAHSDSVQHDKEAERLTNSPGADDDGSGISAIIEAATVLSRYKFQDTFVFAFFNAEEIGLIGSQYWAAEMAARGENVRGAIDLDMVGFSRGVMNYDLDLIYNTRSSSQASDMISTNSHYGLGLRISPTETSDYIPSDIQSMYNSGFNGVFVIEEDFNPYYHTTADTVDKINFTLLKKCTQLSAATLAGWARIEAADAGIASFEVPEHPLEGDEVALNVELVNSGNVPLDNLSVEFRCDGEAFSKQMINLPPGGSIHLDVRWKATFGRHNLSLFVDHEGSFVEVDEGNNTEWAWTETNDRPRSVLRSNLNHVKTDETVSFDGSSSFDRVGSPVVYKFDLGDGNITGWSYEPTIVHSYPEDGSYDVSLTVRDSFGIESAPSVINITVENRPPFANPWADTDTAPTYYPIHFRSEAGDPDGTLSYLWDFGDGSNSADPDPTHEYSKSGICKVTLNVTDDDGARVSGSLWIVVDDRLPEIAAYASPYTGDISTIFTFHANGTDRDGVIRNTKWEMGDGSTIYGRDINYSYARPGVYTVKVSARDDFQYGWMKSLTITVEDRTPVALGNADRVSILSGDPVRFNGSLSGDLEGMVFFRWDFGDGSFSPQESPIHNYLFPGEYKPILWVFDGIGQSAECPLPPVTVRNRLPRAEMVIWGDLVANSTIYFDGSGSNDQEGPITLEWDLGDGGTLLGTLVRRTYAIPGEYRINLTVTDYHGGKTFVERTLSVSAESIPQEPGKGDDPTLLEPILIVTNVLSIIFLLMMLAFFLLRSRDGRREE